MLRWWQRMKEIKRIKTKKSLHFQHLFQVQIYLVNSVLGRVTKLERFKVKRISLSDGKFMAYFATVLEDFEEEEKKDSSVDSDEEKDVVDDIVGGPKASIQKPTS